MDLGFKRLTERCGQNPLPDLFSGLSQGEPGYEAMITRIHEATLAAGLVMGGPMAWRDREGFNFFQAPDAGALIRRGARSILGDNSSRVAPIEGAARR